MLYTIAVIILILWLLGLIFKIAGGLIWILLVIGIIILIWGFISGRRRV